MSDRRLHIKSARLTMSRVLSQRVLRWVAASAFVAACTAPSEPTTRHSLISAEQPVAGTAAAAGLPTITVADLEGTGSITFDPTTRVVSMTGVGSQIIQVDSTAGQLYAVLSDIQQLDLEVAAAEGVGSRYLQEFGQDPGNCDLSGTCATIRAPVRPRGSRGILERDLDRFRSGLTPPTTGRGTDPLTGSLLRLSAEPLFLGVPPGRQRHEPLIRVRGSDGRWLMIPRRIPHRDAGVSPAVPALGFAGPADPSGRLTTMVDSREGNALRAFDTSSVSKLQDPRCIQWAIEAVNNGWAIWRADRAQVYSILRDTMRRAQGEIADGVITNYLGGSGIGEAAAIALYLRSIAGAWVDVAGRRTASSFMGSVWNSLGCGREPTFLGIHSFRTPQVDMASPFDRIEIDNAHCQIIQGEISFDGGTSWNAAWMRVCPEIVVPRDQ